MFSVMASSRMCRITMLLTRTSSTTPPRPRVDLMRMPRSVPSKTQFEIAMLRTPPDISLPMTTPPWPCSMVQFVMVWFSAGRPILRPWRSRPDLIVMQSSPALMWQSEMWTLRHDSGIDPVGVGRVVGVVDGDAADGDVVAVDRVDRPERRVPEGHVLDRDVLAVEQLDERRAQEAHLQHLAIVGPVGPIGVDARELALPLGVGPPDAGLLVARP